MHTDCNESIYTISQLKFPWSRFSEKFIRTISYFPKKSYYGALYISSICNNKSSVKINVSRHLLNESSISLSVWCLQHTCTDERYRDKISINATRSIHRQMYKYAIGKYMAVSMAIISSSIRDLQITWGQSSVPGGLSIVMRAEINGHPDCRLLMVNKLSSIIPAAQYQVITVRIIGLNSADHSGVFGHVQWANLNYM